MTTKDADEQLDELNAKTVGFDYKVVTEEGKAKQVDNAAKNDANNKATGQPVFKFEGKSDKKKKLFEEGKMPGWGGFNEKYMYTDKNVQDLIIVDNNKQTPAGGGAATEAKAKATSDAKKTTDKAEGFKRPQHKPKIHFKPSEALQKDAAKVNDLLEKMIVKMDDEGKPNGTAAPSPTGKEATPPPTGPVKAEAGKGQKKPASKAKPKAKATKEASAKK